MDRTRILNTSAAVAFAITTLLPGATWARTPDAAPPVKKAPAKADADAVAEAKKLIASAPKAGQFPNAAKVTLLDLSDIDVKADGSARTITRQTVKVFNERGRDDQGEVTIPYSADIEKVRVIHARTIKPDGTIVNVKPTDIVDQALSGDGEYSDARALRFSMPAIEPDSIVDYEYETTQKASHMPGQWWSRWYFQSGTDPVVLSKLTVKIPKSLTLKEQIKNTPVKAVVTDADGGKSSLYTWAAKNVDALEPEPMMPSADNVLPTLQVSTLSSWQGIADWYTGLAKDRSVATPEIKTLTATVTKGKTTPEEKAKAIFYYVEEKTRYVAKELGIGAYQPRSASEVCENKLGDCKDMATLLVAMLREAGVTAHPVLLRAGDKDKTSDDLPSPGAFNHAICLAEIDGKKFWLDATAQVCAWGQIPGGDRGVEAFVIRDGKGEFEVIPTGGPEDNRTDQNVQITLKPDGSATGKVAIAGTGDVDMGLRATLTYLPENKMRPFMESLAQRIGPNAKIVDYKTTNPRDKDTPVKISMTVDFPSWATKSGDILVFKARPEQTSGSASSPFRDDDMRTMSVYQPSAAMGVSLLEVTLPTGFGVLSLPAATEVKSDLGKYERKVTQDNGKLTITTAGVNYRANVAPTRIGEVRSYYKDYLRAADESVVVKKN